MRKLRKKYETPKRPWDKERLESEKIILNKFGLRRKKEIWRAEGLLRSYRRLARELAAKRDKDKEKILVNKLIRLGILDEGSVLDDVLSLTVDDILERRLQTIVKKKGMANTSKQSRQFITHGHILINERRTVYPSYIVPKDEEDKISINVIAQKKKEIAEGVENDQKV